MLFSATLGIVDFFPVVPWRTTASMHLGKCEVTTDAGEGLDEKRVDSFQDFISISATRLRSGCEAVPCDSDSTGLQELG